MNLIGDSEFLQLPPARIDAVTPTTGRTAGVASWQGGTWRAVTTRTPVGHRWLAVTTTASSTQGLLIYPTTASPITGPTPLSSGDVVTGSIYMQAPKGQNLAVALPLVTASRAWVRDYVATGAWQTFAGRPGAMDVTPAVRQRQYCLSKLRNQPLEA
ncbi:hypothetical protein [Actinotalea subterranea]|uniref:hypothetical protein n=1 Tax=Actinotalea subterranea TaxID=2607497 RepID=UPI0011F01EEF|nr:hypothetical protein [Actinotalea subterranea]